jgi:hypothetical protein
MRAFNSLFGRQGQSSATARAIKNASACLVEPLEDRALFSISIFELGTMAEDRTGLALQASVPVQAAQAPISKLPIVAAPPIPNGHTPTSKVPDDIFELDASSMSALQGLPGLSGVQFNGCTDIEIAVTIPANELESTPTSAESLIDAFKK